ncbi:MAG: hypothetical protein EBU90_25955 [Proteobacteria bacterium]|nr:hypothetical protein [Pseudomonadota bacterium]
MDAVKTGKTQKKQIQFRLNGIEFWVKKSESENADFILARYEEVKKLKAISDAGASAGSEEQAIVDDEELYTLNEEEEEEEEEENFYDILLRWTEVLRKNFGKIHEESSRISLSTYLSIPCNKEGEYVDIRISDHRAGARCGVSDIYLGTYAEAYSLDKENELQVVLNQIKNLIKTKGFLNDPTGNNPSP